MLKFIFLILYSILSVNQASACVLQVLSSSENKVFIRFEQTPEKRCLPKHFIDFHNVLPKEARESFILKVKEIMNKESSSIEVRKLNSGEIKKAILIDLNQNSSKNIQIDRKDNLSEFRIIFNTSYNEFSPCLKLGFSKSFVGKCDEMEFNGANGKPFWSKELTANLVNNGFGAAEIDFKNNLSVSDRLNDLKNNWDVIFHYQSNPNIATAKERLEYVGNVINDFEKYKNAVLEEWLISAEANQKFQLNVNTVLNEISETISNSKQTLEAMEIASSELKKNSSNLLSSNFEVTKSELAENDLKNEMDQYARGIIPYSKRKQIVDQYLTEIQSNNPFKRVDNLLSMYDLYHTGGFDSSVVKEENGTILSMLLNSEGIISSISHNSELLNQYKFKTDAKSPIGILVRKNINRSLVMPIEVRDTILKDVLIADQIYKSDTNSFGYNNAKRLLNRTEDYFNYYTKNLNNSNTYLLEQSNKSYLFFNTKVTSETFKGHELVKVGNLLAQASSKLNDKVFDFLTKSYFNTAYNLKQSDLERFYSITNKMWDLVYFSRGMVSGIGSSLYDQAKGVVEFVWHPIDSITTLGSAIVSLVNLSSNIPTALRFVMRGTETYFEITESIRNFNELNPEEQGKIIGNISGEITGFIAGPAMIGKLTEVAAVSKAISASAEILAATGKYAGNYIKDLSYVDRVFDSAGDVIEKIGLQNFTNIIKLPKGSRPLPEAYLPKEFIESHLAKFDEGATRFMRKSQFDKYGIAQADGTAFVLSKSEANNIIISTKGDKKLLEQYLGLRPGFLDNEELIRIDISSHQKFNIRIPSGNEAGASDLWIPGGKLADGHSEAVIDANKISINDITVTKLDFK